MKSLIILGLGCAALTAPSMSQTLDLSTMHAAPLVADAPGDDAIPARAGHGLTRTMTRVVARPDANGVLQATCDVEPIQARRGDTPSPRRNQRERVE